MCQVNEWQTLLLILVGQLSSTFLNIETTDENFQQSEKQDSFRQILKSSGSQLLRITTRTISGPDVFDKLT